MLHVASDCIAIYVSTSAAPGSTRPAPAAAAARAAASAAAAGTIVAIIIVRGTETGA